MTLQATGNTNILAIAEKKLSVTFKCRCINFTLNVDSEYSHVFGDDPTRITVPDPVCSLDVACQVDAAGWKYNYV